MNTRRMFQIVVITAILLMPLVSTGKALAWSGCANYITVQWGDTLSGIAKLCGTTVEAIQAANPGLGWWVYAGQILCIPNGYSSPQYPTYGYTYTVQWGDTLGKIAVRSGISMYDLLAVNPQIQNASLIYTGQVINLPTGVVVSPPVSYPPPSYPSPSNPSGYGSLKITYRKGLLVRNGPGGDIIGWATYDKYKVWYYSAVVTDSNGKVWAQVTLDPPQSGCTLGWILVRDQLGNYFTEPQIDW